ncbi:MAG: hypothetical protein ABII22_04225 [Candidatus Micrarchaeota archaeon]
MKSMKGQISLEVLITLGVILAFSLPVLFLMLTVSNYSFESSALQQADATAGMLADSIEDVYAQGPGAKRMVPLNVPSNTELISVSDDNVMVRLKVTNGFYDAVVSISARAKIADGVTLPKGPFVAILEVKETDDPVTGEKYYEVEVK